MIRALSILAAIVALAVSAAPVASAGPGNGGGTDHAWGVPYFKAVAGPSKARVGGKMHLEDVSLGVKASPQIILERHSR